MILIFTDDGQETVAKVFLNAGYRVVKMGRVMPMASGIGVDFAGWVILSADGSPFIHEGSWFVRSDEVEGNIWHTVYRALADTRCS